MLVFGFELPAAHPRGPMVLVVILEKENLDRMRQADPVDAAGVDTSGRAD